MTEVVYPHARRFKPVGTDQNGREYMCVQPGDSLELLLTSPEVQLFARAKAELMFPLPEMYDHLTITTLNGTVFAAVVETVESKYQERSQVALVRLSRFRKLA